MALIFSNEYNLDEFPKLPDDITRPWIDNEDDFGDDD